MTWIILREIFFPAVDKLDRRSFDLHGRLDRRAEVIEFQTVSETAATELIVQNDLIGPISAYVGSEALGKARHLRRRPDVNLPIRCEDGGIQRLERLMRHVRCAVLGFD